MTRLTLAGPGAGKTQDLTDQINDRLKSGTNPYSILAITFSRRAACVITERTRGAVEGHTFHGFANWLRCICWCDRYDICGVWRGIFYIR
ncbi:MAG: AAA family ATPase [Anaerolineales bacterium]|nr:AAA family ATPase [Anaerolineales bacterium]